MLANRQTHDVRVQSFGGRFDPKTSKWTVGPYFANAAAEVLLGGLPNDLVVSQASLQLAKREMYRAHIIVS